MVGCGSKRGGIGKWGGRGEGGVGGAGNGSEKLVLAILTKNARLWVGCKPALVRVLAV